MRVGELTPVVMQLAPFRHELAVHELIIWSQYTPVYPGWQVHL